MRRFLLIITLVILLPCTAFGLVNHRPPAKFEPPSAKVLPIIGQSCEAIGGVEGYPSDNSYYNNIVSESSSLMPVAVTFYGFLQFDDQSMPALSIGGEEGCLAYFKLSELYRNTVLHLSLGIKDVNSEVADGIFDEAIIELARYISELERPVFLRIGYEFDNPGHGNPNGAIFAQAFRRIVDIIRSQGVDNFATVFASTFKVQLPLITPSYEQYYPGDDYVDWVGFSYWGGPLLKIDLGAGMMSFARQKGKPVMIGESAPMFARLNNYWLNLLGLNNLWWNIFYQRYFDFIKANSDIVRAFHYIAEDWSLNNEIWRSTPIYYPFIDMNSQIHQNQFIKQRWIEELNRPEYLNSEDEKWWQN